MILCDRSRRASSGIAEESSPISHCTQRGVITAIACRNAENTAMVLAIALADGYCWLPSPVMTKAFLPLPAPLASLLPHNVNTSGVIDKTQHSITYDHASCAAERKLCRRIWSATSH